MSGMLWKQSLLDWNEPWRESMFVSVCACSVFVYGGGGALFVHRELDKNLEFC